MGENDDVFWSLLMEELEEELGEILEDENSLEELAEDAVGSKEDLYN